MIASSKVHYISTAVSSLARAFTSLRISQYAKPRSSCSVLTCNTFRTSPPKLDLMEFFDHKDNWGENEVKVGRAWRKEELRIKSSTDLHKLWFVLLKERNMLLTMEYEAKERMKLFPNPERIDKVKESMENLETVVRERNQAYFKLETGESGEQPVKIVTDAFGLYRRRKLREYSIPIFMNRKWQKTHFQHKQHGYDVDRFLLLYRERLSLQRRRKLHRRRNHVMMLLKRFPDLDRRALRAQYPDVALEYVEQNKKTVGHHEKNTA